MESEHDDRGCTPRAGDVLSSRRIACVVSLALAVMVPMATGLPARAEPVVAESEEIGLVNEERPERDVLFGGQPTAEQLLALAASGYRTVIDLRMPDESRGFDQAALLQQKGVEYQVIGWSKETLEDPQTIAAAVAAFESAERPLLVHCASGNRVGALYYAVLAGRGVEPEAALEQARDNGLRSDALAETIGKWLKESDNP